MYLKELILSSAVSHQICFFALFLVESLFFQFQSGVSGSGIYKTKGADCSSSEKFCLQNCVSHHQFTGCFRTGSGCKLIHCCVDIILRMPVRPSSSCSAYSGFFSRRAEWMYTRLGNVTQSFSPREQYALRGGNRGSVCMYICMWRKFMGLYNQQ